MRIDVKRVKGNEYVQLVDRLGHVFHVGSATDFDSWLIAFMVWEKEWSQEYLRKRDATLERVEHEIGKHVSIRNLELQTLDEIRQRDRYYFRAAYRPLSVPRSQLFGNLAKRDNLQNLQYPYRWVWNKRAETVDKRLKEIALKQRRTKRKEEKIQLEARKKEIQKSSIDLRAKQEKRNKVLSLIVQTQMAKGLIELPELLNEATLRHGMTKEETENAIIELLRDGTIYEPRTGCYRIT
jgi:hypothetical protein